jgi:Uma2 family endonuclease
MATATVDWPLIKLRNCDELQEYLGGIPTRRIRIQPPPGEGTESDLLKIHDKEGRICELIDGILVEKDMASYEALLAGVLLHFIQSYLDHHDLGVALPGDGWLRLYPGLVRAPDVSFISWKRMPNQEFPDEAIASLRPDLAVEILSEGNTEREMDRKLKEYFRSGCKLVWYVDPKKRTVRVFTSATKSKMLTEKDTLDGGKLLPGFTLPIKRWFARASRKPRR